MTKGQLKDKLYPGSQLIHINDIHDAIQYLKEELGQHPQVNKIIDKTFHDITILKNKTQPQKKL